MEPTGAADRATIQGYLTKQGGSHRSWKKRYCVLKNRELRYYTKKEAMDKGAEPIDTIPVAGCPCLRAPEMKKKQFCFKVESKIENSRVYYFNAYSIKEMDDWLTTLQIASGVDSEVIEDSNEDPESTRKRVLKTGQLEKKGGFEGKKSFKKRFFYLDHERLAYYATSSDSKPKGVIELRGAKMIETSDQFNEFMLKGGQTSRVYQFRAETREEMRDWVEAIMGAIQKLETTLIRARNHWMNKILFIFFQRWQEAMNLKGMEEFAVGDYYFFANDKFEMLEGSSQLMMQEYEAKTTVKLRQLGEGSLQSDTIAREDTDMRLTILQNITGTPRLVSEESIAKTKCLTDDFCVWKGYMMITENTRDEASCHVLLRRKHLPPMADRYSDILVTVQKIPRQAGGDDVRKIALSISETLTPRKPSEFDDYEKIDVEDAHLFYPMYAYADVLLDIVPSYLQESGTFVQKMDKICRGFEPEETFTTFQVEAKKIPPWFLSVCFLGHIIERVNVPFLFKAYKNKGEEAKKRVVYLVNRCLGGELAEVLKKPLAEFEGNIDFLAALLNSGYMEEQFVDEEIIEINNEDPVKGENDQTDEKDEKDGKVDKEGKEGKDEVDAEDVDVEVGAGIEENDEKEEEDGEGDEKKTKSTTSPKKGTGDKDDDKKESNVKIETTKIIKRIEHLDPDYARALANLLSWDTPSMDLRVAIMIRIGLLLSRFGEEFREPLLEAASGEGWAKTMIKAATDTKHMPLLIATLRALVNLSSGHSGVKSVLIADSAFLNSLREFLAMRRFPDVIFASCTILKNLSSGGIQEDIVNITQSGELVTSLWEQIVLMSDSLDTDDSSSSSVEKAMSAMFSFLWTVGQVKTMKRMLLSTKGFFAAMSKILRESKDENLQFNVIGLLLTLVQDWGDKIARFDLIEVMANMLLVSVFPNLMRTICACLLVLSKSASALRKMKNSNAMAGAKRAMRFKKDPKLVHYAHELVYKLGGGK
eukprot:TRINITY_DN146_c1_g1_i2.p1 TRINITY_DN146_c1_g1~~TRINITY_DN146_c1_g1_i2.p1  ORF type:complete len:986 (-),score=307.91 TRINITY_DN146_c1_g1_i2:258-3215(-)